MAFTQQPQIKSQTKHVSPALHFSAGLLSGLTSSVLLQPAEVLKTRVQQSQSASLLAIVRQITSAPKPVQQLWRGTLPSTLRTGFGSALYFSTLNSIRQRLAHSSWVRTDRPDSTALPSGDAPNPSMARGNDARSTALPKLPASLNILAGAVSRTAVGFVMMPITVLKVRFESSVYAYTSLFAAGKNIVHQEGLSGLFRGFGATAARDAPYAGLFILFYEASKDRVGSLLDRFHFIRPESGARQAAMVNSSSSILAAVLATAVTNPFDAVKTRVQLFPQQYTNAIQTAVLMAKEEGWRVFFDGLGIRMARKAASSALAWTIYEEFVRRAKQDL